VPQRTAHHVGGLGSVIATISSMDVGAVCGNCAVVPGGWPALPSMYS